MADPTPPPNPTPDPNKKPKQTHSFINRRYLAEIKNSRAVAAAAEKADNAGKLAEVEMDSSLPMQIITLASQIESALEKLPGTRAAKREMTAQEISARDSIIAAILPIQTAAKRQFTGAQTPLRAAYFIGENLSRAMLDEVLAAAHSIYARLTPDAQGNPPQDVLPGIKASPQLSTLNMLISRYTDSDTAQAQQETLAGGSLETIGADVIQLGRLRHTIQLAADQAWPWRTDGVATIRKEFLLPVDRPLSA